MCHSFPGSILGGLLAVLAAGLPATTMAAPVSVVAGSDYLQMLPGSQLDLGGAVGVVTLQGQAIGPGATDMVVRRLGTATVAGAPVATQATAVSWQNATPVNIGGSFFDVFITLDPANLANDVGTLAIGGDGSGGTFTTFFDLFLEIDIAPVGGGTPTVQLSQYQVSGTGTWSPTAPLNAQTVSGDTADPNANLHSGLDPSEVDFFPLAITSTDIEDVLALNQTASSETTAVPEPGTLAVVASGLLWLAAHRWRRRPATT